MKRKLVHLIVLTIVLSGFATFAPMGIADASHAAFHCNDCVVNPLEESRFVPQNNCNCFLHEATATKQNTKAFTATQPVVKTITSAVFFSEDVHQESFVNFAATQWANAPPAFLPSFNTVQQLK